MLVVSCMFWPTAGMSAMTGIENLDNVDAGPTPESIGSCWEWNCAY